MHNYSVISLFPKMFKSLTDSGITSRVINKKIAEINFFNPRDYTSDNYKSIDDTSFGGGPGMVMKPEPLFLAHQEACQAAHKEISDNISNLKSKKIKTICFAPQGKVLNQKKIQNLARSGDNLILVCGRYEGIDQRFIDTCVDEVISIGDFILSGGEIPAMTLLDGIFRLLPGSIKEESVADESFSDNLLGLLEAPQYTKPANWRDIKVPDVLLSGDHKKIKSWREIESLKITANIRPDLLKIFLKLGSSRILDKILSKEQKKWLEAYILDSKNQI
jgi:tRNA (guanine37-N1)-methyltransferase